MQEEEASKRGRENRDDGFKRFHTRPDIASRTVQKLERPETLILKETRLESIAGVYIAIDFCFMLWLLLRS
jgi:hypothetical protein